MHKPSGNNDAITLPVLAIDAVGIVAHLLTKGTNKQMKEREIQCLNKKKEWVYGNEITRVDDKFAAQPLATVGGRNQTSIVSLHANIGLFDMALGA